MTAASVVQRVGCKSGRIAPLARLPWWLGAAGPTLDELAAMPPWFARAVFGVAVIPLPIVRPIKAAPPARRPHPRQPRTALGTGVVQLGRAVSP
ncbi:hypothetical protein [Sorangium sp. So ce176]|uniref:hypothetical protein n=1 Tax=Sorangium sp. So ce176 TaxID=3133286 RepID=UPI003F602B04